MKNILKSIGFILLVLVAIVIYVLSIKGVPGNPSPLDFKNNLDQASKPMELSPERGRFALTMSLVENKSFALTKTLADAVYPDAGYYQGRFYIFFAPGISIMAMPLYLLGKYFGLSQVLTFSLSAIFALLNAYFIYQISHRVFKLTNWASLFGSLAFTFASTAWAYAVTLYQHQATTLFLLSAFYHAWRFRNKMKASWLSAIWVWTASGLAISIDYPNALFIMPILIYFSLSAFSITKIKEKIQLTFRLSLVFTSLFFIFLIGLHGYYNYIQFGSPIRLSGSLVSIKTVYQNENLDQNTQDQLIQKEANRKNVVKFFSEEKFPMSFTILTVSPDRGLFLYSPIYIVGFLGLFLAVKKHRNWEVTTLLSTGLVIFFLYSSWGDPWGGWAFGPRYLIPVFGILSIFISYSLNQIKSIFYKLFTYLLFLYSSAIALLGVLTTNAVPPRIEAIALNTGYNFLYNLKFLNDNHSSSYIYNTYFLGKISLFQYALPIYFVLAITGFMFLFILPRFEKRHES